MASTKDYYDILGLKRSANAEEIKQAYRKLAREHHPDVAKTANKSEAEKKFKEINEAYQVLSDPQKKQTYDQYGSAAFSGGAAGNAGGPNQGGQWGPFSYSYSSGGQNPGDFGFGGDFDPFDVFEQFFGFRGTGGNPNRPRKGKSLYYEMHVDFKDAIFGLEKEISAESGKLTVKIPAGIRDGMEMRFAQKGMPGINGGPAGDLHLTIRVITPKQFEVYGDDLVVKAEIDFSSAILGTTLEIPVIDLKDPTGIGKNNLKIPEGTQYGTKMLVRGKGMPRLKGKGQGDVIVVVTVSIPKKINKTQKELLEKYRAS